MKRLAALLGIVGVCVSGCLTAPVPPGPTSVELSQLRYSESIGSESFGTADPVGDLPRGVVRFLSSASESATDPTCSETAPWRASVDGVVMLSIGDGGAIQVSTLDNGRSCQLNFEVHLKELRTFSSAQLDAIYDYYRDWLMPCIAVHGYSVLDKPVSRTEFSTIVGGVPWSPYWSVDFSDSAPEAIDELYALCPALPEFALQ